MEKYNYEDAYYKLFNGVTDIINLYQKELNTLKTLQKYVEEIVISSET